MPTNNRKRSKSRKRNIPIYKSRRRSTSRRRIITKIRSKSLNKKIHRLLSLTLKIKILKPAF